MYNENSFSVFLNLDEVWSGGEQFVGNQIELPSFVIRGAT
jgi:hypothetical protein